MPRTTPPAPALQAFIARLPVPAVLTAGPWRGGGADMVFANREFCRLTGYRAAELRGRNTRLLHGRRTDVARLRSGGTAREGSGEGWLHRKNGSAFFAQWSYRAAAPGRPHLLVVFYDHTELRHQRDALLQAQKLGTAGQLAGGMAHDFNNLLSLINGYCEIIATQVADRPAVFRDLQEIHRAGLKATAVARQMLEFSRRRESESVVVNFNALLRETADLIRQVCGEAIELELRLASDLGNARFNPVHFQQVLLNLCLNARDAMPRGGRLTLRTYNRPAADRAPGEVALAVSDTGHGIETALQGRVFEPFYTTKPQGTGLGLPTAQTLVQEAGGRLEMRSQPGHGTTFELFLPETAEPAVSAETTLTPLPARCGTEAVAVIERDDGLRKMIAGVLGMEGYAVTAFASADEAAAAESVPQLAIADTQAPKGIAALRRLQARGPAMKLISTADRAPSFPWFTRRGGTHVPKPFALGALVTHVRRLLDAPAG